MSGAVTVTKLNWRGEKVYSWRGDIAAREPGHVALRAEWRGPGTIRVADEVTFEAGDVFYEHYYQARPYGLWQVLTPDEQRLKCWYCNVSTPAEVGDEAISFRDLLLDVLLLPNGAYQVLDRDELAAALDEGLEPSLAALAESAVGEIIGLIESGSAPFHRH